MNKIQQQHQRKEYIRTWIASIREEQDHTESTAQKEEYASMISYILSLPIQDSYKVIVWRLEGVEYHKRMTLSAMQYYIKEGSLVLPDLEDYGPATLDHIDI